MKKILGLLAMMLVTAPMMGACGTSEGDTCQTDNDCSGQLECQPIAGRGVRCCPTPPASSDNIACHEVGDTAISPISTSAPATGTGTSDSGS